jgi:UDP-N-acetylglucosamine 2-epimerase
VRVVSIVGTRPQLIKAAALQPELRARHDEIFVDTGQHWDESLAGSFFRELALARPDHSLAAGGGSHSEQTAAMLVGLEPILRSVRPDAALVYGDTNSTLAGALAAAKLGIPVAHVEAGLRSFDRRMPEELNRIVVDHLAAWTLAPSQAAVGHLRAEGISDGVVLVGDLMQDLAARTLDGIRDPGQLAQALAALPGSSGPPPSIEPGGYLFVTIHRAENREPAAVRTWASLLRRVAREDRVVVVALHPGTRKALLASGEDLGPHVFVREPLGYRSSLALQLHAAAVLTDSGGVQRESAWLGVPCLVLRSSTEWGELIDQSAGRMALIGLDAGAAEAALARIAPSGGDQAEAIDRGARARIEPTGAAAAIARAIEGEPRPLTR